MYILYWVAYFLLFLWLQQYKPNVVLGISHSEAMIGISAIVVLQWMGEVAGLLKKNNNK